MIQVFVRLAALLSLFTILLVVHYITYNKNAMQEKLQNMSHVSNISSFSLSVAYYEPRILFNEEVIHPAYPQMLPIHTMDFIYAK